jgi:hypothetical protein
VLLEEGIPKEQQFRLYTHINNKIRPIQNYMEYLLRDEMLNAAIAIRLKEKAAEQKKAIDLLLEGVNVYASLLVQKPIYSIYESYIKSVDKLYKALPEYQKLNHEILHSVLARCPASQD